jgi:hypothetical protein
MYGATSLLTSELVFKYNVIKCDKCARAHRLCDERVTNEQSNRTKLVSSAVISQYC